MTKNDYDVILGIVKKAEFIENCIKNCFQNSLAVFRNRPRRGSVTAPKAICLLFVYQMSQFADCVSKECAAEHPEVPWGRIQCLRYTIISKEKGFFAPKTAWRVLKEEMPLWRLECSKILENSLFCQK